MRSLLENDEARAELLIALCLIVLSVAVWIAADTLPPPIFDPVGSAAVPKAVAALIAILSLAMLGQRLKGHADVGTVPEPADPDPAPPPLRYGIATACFAVMVAYPLVMGIGLFGFREATFLFVLALGGFLARFDRRTMLILLPVALVLAIGLSQLFSDVFYIDLPVTAWLPF